MKYPSLSKYPIAAIDFETTGLDWWKDHAFMVSVSLPDGQDIWIDLDNDEQGLHWARTELPKLPEFICHNAKFDMHFGRESGIILDPTKAHCTLIRAALIDEHLFQYDLDSLGEKYLGERKVDIIPELAKMFGGRATKNVQMKNLHRAPREFSGKYAAQDTRLTLNLFNHQEPIIKELGLGPIYQLERDLIQVLLDMEHQGVIVDIDRAEKAQGELEEQIWRVQKALNKEVGFKFGVDSPKDIKKVFNPKEKDGQWYTDRGELLGKTGKGAASFNKDTLNSLKDPRAKMMLEIREMSKLVGTFIEGHILGSQHNGRVHTTFNQTKTDRGQGTGTGRLSSTSPNLEQIHKRNKKIASIVRAMFLPEDGHEWYCRDWEQMDFRIFAHYVNEETINRQYAADPMTDFHRLTANMTGLPRSAGDVPGVKGNAKQVNLGLVFGMGEGTLAEEMGLLFTIDDRGYKKAGPEAQEVFKKYHSTIPGVKQLLNRASSVAKSRGYVKTILGRRINFPKSQFTYKAGGLIFQGTAADALKYKLIEVWKYLKGKEGRLILNVHDEFDMSLGNPDLDLGVKEIIEDFQSEPFNLRIPIRSDVGHGFNWWEACK